MKKLLILICCIAAVSAQAQLSTSRKLYQLCKVWGYLKYHHPNNCNIPWNALLMEKVDSVANAANNNDFNAILYNMCLQTGVTSPPATPTVIPGDSAKNYNTDWFNDADLSPSVRDFLDSVQAHSISNTNGCLLRYNNYQDPNYISYIDFRRDSVNNIPGFSYGNLKHRMLAYFYYWNTVKYFFPQIDIADHNWDSTLVQLMPGMINAATDSSFELTLAQVVSRIDDSHGTFNSRYFYKFLTGIDYTTQSFYYPRLTIARVQNKNVIIASGENNINRGDILTKINGIDADTFLEQWKPYVAASNEITKYRNLYTWLLYGNPALTKNLELLDANNNTRQVALTVNTSYAQFNSWYASSVDTMPEWCVTACGYGYVNMGKLTPANVAAMYQALKNTPAIIFDIRNYPKSTLWNIKPLLFPAPNISARFFSPDLTYPGYYFTEDDHDNFGTWNNSAPYTGKVIILVNEQTQSQAEYTAQTLRTFPNSVIIGSQTAGADGNIVYVDLPNNIRTYWSGLGWYQQDWFNPQRAGVHVDSIVTPTINGVRNGTDEVLAKALDCKLSVPAVAANGEYGIYHQAHTLTVSSPYNTAYNIDICNAVGQRVFTQAHNMQRTTVHTDDLAPGIYIVIVSGSNGTAKRQKIVIQ